MRGLGTLLVETSWILTSEVETLNWKLFFVFHGKSVVYKELARRKIGVSARNCGDVGDIRLGKKADAAQGKSNSDGYGKSYRDDEEHPERRVKRPQMQDARCKMIMDRRT